ncbi:MAG: dynamin family protein [Pirellulales bacterium]|nr:dynamin family protein [Pirellulales bacterium]
MVSHYAIDLCTTHGPTRPAEARKFPNGEFAEQLTSLTNVVNKFELVSFKPGIHACETLSRNEPIDLAVLGQFKSGKSSLLNAILGEAMLPVGVLPLTAVVTRLVSGMVSIVRVTHLDGRIEELTLDRLAEFVTEAGNPRNHRQVAIVDVVTPLMNDLPDVRLVDTPGLGSLFAHNTEATRAWMPNVAAAIVTVSAERPLSDEDLRLVTEALKTAPRVVAVLTKVDLLTDTEREQVLDFLQDVLCEKFDTEIPILPFSIRHNTGHWLGQLRENLLLPLARNVAGERRAALSLKLSALTQSCCDYLSIGIQSAERTDADRERLRAAVLDETVSVAVIEDELRLAEQGIRSHVRSEFENYFLGHYDALWRGLSEILASEFSLWEGNLAKQTRQYQGWMKTNLLTELTRLSDEAVSVADEIMTRAEERFRRIVEAFRDRLSRNIHQAMGISVSPLAWQAMQPALTAVPVQIGQTFMVHWDLLWWMLPMKMIGGIFRKHALQQVPVEVEKNLRRLVSDWANSVDQAIANLRSQARNWVQDELATLDQLLAREPSKSPILHAALRELTYFTNEQ